MVEETLKEVVDRMVVGLSDGKRRRFGEKLESCLHDREWCRIHNIDYSNPNVGLARAELYGELYINKPQVLL